MNTLTGIRQQKTLNIRLCWTMMVILADFSESILKSLFVHRRFSWRVYEVMLSAQYFFLKK